MIDVTRTAERTGKTGWQTDRWTGRRMGGQAGRRTGKEAGC